MLKKNRAINSMGSFRECWDMAKLSRQKGKYSKAQEKESLDIFTKPHKISFFMYMNNT